MRIKVLGLSLLITSFLIGNNITLASGPSCGVTFLGGTSQVVLHKKFDRLKSELKKVVLDQDELIDNLLITIIANGHLLIEGPPGTAKTRLVESLSKLLNADYKRVQFTIATEPSELTGYEQFNHLEKNFEFKKGSLFANIVLIDEINRSTPKTQSALLQAMSEKIITQSGVTYKLPEIHLVIATQNPSDQIGTFPLPEAQLDRFMMKLVIPHPKMETENKILDLVLAEKLTPQSEKQNTSVLELSDILEARKALLNISEPQSIRNYILNIIQSTRTPIDYAPHLNNTIIESAGTRGTINLALAARAHAWLNNKTEVGVTDVDAVVIPVLRHIVKLSDSANQEGQKVDNILKELIKAAKTKTNIKSSTD